MKVALKLIISLVLLYFIYKQIDIQKLIEIFKVINIFYFLCAFLLYNISKIVSALRLNYYFKEIGLNLKESINLKLYYVGMFYNLFLPGGIGGDGYKVYILKKLYSKKASQLLKALFFDRVSGLVALLFLASLLFTLSKYSFSPFKEINYLLVISIYPIFYYITKRYNFFLKYFKQTTILGLIVQIIQLISAYYLILALNIENSLTIEFLFLFLISSLLSILPVTIGGIGIRELTFLYGLKFIDTTPDIGVAFSFLFFIVTLLSSLIGVFFIKSKFK